MNASLRLAECELGRNLFEAEFLPGAIESQPGPTAPYRIPYQTTLNPSRGPYRTFTGVPTGSLPNPCQVSTGSLLDFHRASAESLAGFYWASSSLIETTIEALWDPVELLLNTPR